MYLWTSDEVLLLLVFVTRFQVRSKCTHPAVAPTTVLTYVDWSVLGSNVSDAVRRQVRGSRELPVTVLAGVWFESAVEALVHVQLGHLSEPRRAHGTLERTYTGVNALVHDEVGTSHEALATHFTHVRPAQHSVNVA